MANHTLLLVIFFAMLAGAPVAPSAEVCTPLREALEFPSEPLAINQALARWFATASALDRREFLGIDLARRTWQGSQSKSGAESLFGVELQREDHLLQMKKLQNAQSPVRMGRTVYFRGAFFPNRHFYDNTLRYPEHRATVETLLAKLQSQPRLALNKPRGSFETLRVGSSNSIIVNRNMRKLYRGLSTQEFQLLKGIKLWRLGILKGADKGTFVRNLKAIREEWRVPPELVSAVDQALTDLERSLNQPTLSVAESLVGLISARTGSGGGYGGIFTSPDRLAIEQHWKSRKGTIATFSVRPAALAKDPGVYAGFESLAREGGNESTYIEVAFFLPESKLYLADSLMIGE